MLMRKMNLFVFAVSAYMGLSSVIFADGILEPLGSQNYNTPNTNNIRIVSKNIQANNDPNDYGVLLNNYITGENCDIISNIIYSPTADAIEINTTSGNFRAVKIIGNTLYGGEAGTSINSGFSIGIAKGKDIIAIGNISKVSRQEALHIEDASENLTISNNIFLNCYKDGARILYRSGSSPVIISNNIFKKKSTYTGQDNGIWVIKDPYGIVNQNIVTNNWMDGFAYGIKTNGENTFANNLITNCDVAISNTGTIHGVNFASDCDTLVKGNTGSITGKIISYTKPTTILEYVGTNGFIGTTLKGFSYPLNSFSTTQGYSTISLFPLATRFDGNLLLTLTSGNYDYITYSAHINWDGTDLTVSNIIKKHYGVFSAPQLLTENGNLNLKFYSASAKTVSKIKLDFDGIYYQD